MTRRRPCCVCVGTPYDLLRVSGSVNASIKHKTADWLANMYRIVAAALQPARWIAYHKPQQNGAVAAPGRYDPAAASRDGAAASTATPGGARSVRALNGRFGRLILFMILLLTSAVAMKFATLVMRARNFHPNWPARSAASGSQSME